MIVYEFQNLIIRFGMMNSLIIKAKNSPLPHELLTFLNASSDKFNFPKPRKIFSSRNVLEDHLRKVKLCIGFSIIFLIALTSIFIKNRN